MRMLIDGGSLQENRLNAEKTEIIFRCLHILTKKETDADWLLLTEDAEPGHPLSALPAEQIAVGKVLGGLLGQKFGRRRRILSGIRQSGATHLLTFNGAFIPGLPIPQCNRVPVFSAHEKKDWLENHDGSAAKPVLLYGGPEEGILPLPWVEREKGKIRFAAGREYFLLFFDGLSSSDLVGVLKAFSLFKKRQQSNMQLVFAGRGETPGDFPEKLKSYKYRDDVHIREDLPVSSQALLIGSAYALLSPLTEQATGLTLFTAFQSGVPAVLSGASPVTGKGAPRDIASPAGPLAEIAGEAALYTEAGDTAGLADRMMSLYKDENLRNNLINKGKSRLSFFSWEASAQELWNEIRQTAQDSEKGAG